MTEAMRCAVDKIALAVALLLAGAGCEPDVTPAPLPQPFVAAELDLTAMPPVVPTPNDLAFKGGDGVHLNVPDLPSDSPAQRALNAYLRTLTGFPPGSPLQAQFSGALDPASLTVQTASQPGAIVVVDVTAGALAPNLSATLSSDGKTITVVSGDRFKSGHQYAALLVGGDDAHGLRAANGLRVLASPTFFFLRSPLPLVQRCGGIGNPVCVCPPAGIATDPTCHSAVIGLSDADARQLEPLRAQLSRLLSPLVPLLGPGRTLANVVLAWSFTITAQPIAEVDPASGALPFPNDALIDPTTGLVNLPVAANDPLAPLVMQLNTLDGFSVSAAITLPVDTAGAPVDQPSLQPGLTTLLINLDPTPGAAQPLFNAVATAAASPVVALVPVLPLVSDQRRYAVVVTRAVTAGGANLVPAPATVLLLQDGALFDGMHSTVNVLDDAQAQQLEALRQALHPLLTLLTSHGLALDDVAALWTFTTQSIVRPLAALAAFPTQVQLSTDVTATVYQSFASLPAALQPLVADVRAVVLGRFTSQLVYDPATRHVHLVRTALPSLPSVRQADTFSVVAPNLPITIRFWLTLPKSASPSGAPLTIAQHGLTSWRGDLFPLGEALARGGNATIAFDIDFHGARTRCSSDSQCAGGAAGSCDTNSGACAGGFAVATNDPLACVLAAFSGDMVNDCEPAASGNGYLDVSDLFGDRAGGYQYVADAAQLVRVVTATGGNSLQAKLAAAGLPHTIDAGHLAFLGHSLGAIDGTLLLAVEPAINGADVLANGGGHLFEIIADGALHPVVDNLLAGLHIMRGTPQYTQLVQTARWVLDPVDPFSVAPYVHRTPALSYVTGTTNAPKLVIAQEAGMDEIVPPADAAALSLSLWGPNGVDAMGNAQGANAGGVFSSTFFADATHETLVTGMPSPAMRTQAVTYVVSDGAILQGAAP
jgi:hypothetical protein